MTNVGNELQDLPVRQLPGGHASTTRPSIAAPTPQIVRGAGAEVIAVGAISANSEPNPVPAKTLGS
jgi:hypothetical protein